MRDPFRGWWVVAWALALAACARAVAPTPLSGVPTRPTARPAVFALPVEAGTFRLAQCPFVLPEGVREGEAVECGYLGVVEGRDGHSDATPGRVIQLAVAIFHRPGGVRHQDPVIFLSGGPGASALEPLRYQFEVLSEPVFETGRDLVVFDQRGVGLSRPALDCPVYDELDLELLDRQIDGRTVSDDEAAEMYLNATRTCRDELAAVADLSAYHSAASAADVEDLRRALGYAKVNLWGGSYGTRLALEVMRRFPQSVRSVVLDAVYPPEVDLYVQAPANFERALNRLFDACAANTICAAAHPNLRDDFFATVEGLNAEPVVLETEDPITGDLQRTWMNGNTLLALTFQLLYDSRLRYLLPEQFEAARLGDFRVFERVLVALTERSRLSSRGMMLSVQCHEEVAFSSFDALQAELGRHPLIAAMYPNSILGGLAYRACSEWGAGRAEPSANEPVSSDIPTLLMTGEFDPITPPAWGQQAAAHLAHAYFYEYPGVGHGASALPGCPQQMFVAFLEDPHSPPHDACMASMR